MTKKGAQHIQNTYINSPWYNGAASLTSHSPTCHIQASNWREREQSQKFLFSLTGLHPKCWHEATFLSPSSSLPQLSPAALSLLSSSLNPLPSSSSLPARSHHLLRPYHLYHDCHLYHHHHHHPNPWVTEFSLGQVLMTGVEGVELALVLMRWTCSEL